MDTEFGGEYGRLWSPRADLTPAAARTHDSWFGGPVGSRVSPLFTVDNGAPPPTREGDEFFCRTVRSPTRPAT